MERFRHLYSVVRPDAPGIEIGPWRHPVAPKRDGYRTTVIDVLDTDQLRVMARERNTPDHEIPLIEEVDIVGDGSNLLELIRGQGRMERFSWIVSCHNFEHLPDPIRFLCDCEQLLEPAGALAMIIPDKRYSIDRFQPPATVAGMLRTWIGGPGLDDTAWSQFSQQALAANLIDAGGKRQLVWSDERNRNEAVTLVTRDLRQCFARLRKDLGSGAQPQGFHGHRWRFTPAVFELLILDLRALGVVSLEVETFPADGVEFSAILRPCPPWNPSSEEYVAMRSGICRRMENEAAIVTDAYLAIARELEAVRAEIAGLRSCEG